jgi:phage protein U
VNSHTETGDSDIEVFKSDAVEPTIIVKGPSERTLAVQGSISVAGQTNAQLNTSYLIPLRAMRAKEVTLVSPDAQFDGLWVLKSYSFRRVSEGAVVKRYAFSLTFIQGADALTL